MEKKKENDQFIDNVNKKFMDNFWSNTYLNNNGIINENI